MKLLKSTPERDWYLVKEFTTLAGLKARIQQCRWKRTNLLHDHYTGYVQVPDGDTTNYYDDQDGVDVHGGVTFYDSIEGEEGKWVGFDLAHYGDENLVMPLTYAEDECEKLAAQLTENGKD